MSRELPTRRQRIAVVLYISAISILVAGTCYTLFFYEPNFSDCFDFGPCPIPDKGDFFGRVLLVAAIVALAGRLLSRRGGGYDEYFGSQQHDD